MLDGKSFMGLVLVFGGILIASSLLFGGASLEVATTGQAYQDGIGYNEEELDDAWEKSDGDGVSAPTVQENNEGDLVDGDTDDTDDPSESDERYGRMPVVEAKLQLTPQTSFPGLEGDSNPDNDMQHPTVEGQTIDYYCAEGDDVIDYYQGAETFNYYYGEDGNVVQVETESERTWDHCLEDNEVSPFIEAGVLDNDFENVQAQYLVEYYCSGSTKVVTVTSCKEGCYNDGFSQCWS